MLLRRQTKTYIFARSLSQSVARIAFTLILPSVLLSVSLFICMSIRLFLSICLFVYVSLRLFVYLYVSLTSLSVRLCLSVCLSVCVCVSVCVCLSVCLYVCVFALYFSHIALFFYSFLFISCCALSLFLIAIIISLLCPR